MRVEISNRQSAVDVSAQEVRRVLRIGLDQESKDARLSVALVGDRDMEALNQRFLGCSGVTDVLAFPYGSEGDAIAGEIVVNAELAAREAERRPHTAQDELMLYLVHGLLHLLGYNDGEAPETELMRQREQAILEAAGRAVEF